jgi:branched-chain amino acid transport system ATP-binding protein
MRGVEIGREASANSPSSRREDPMTVPEESGILVGRGLTVTYGTYRAVDGVDLELAPGEILGIVGPNGAGKTTLFNVISGAARLSDGSLSLDGLPLGDMSPERRAALGIARTFQNLLLLPQLTVLENVALGAAQFRRSRFLEVLTGLPRSRQDDRLARQIARRALQWVGMAAAEDVLAGSLPYADRRRVELARALAAGPRVLLVDEPAAGMTGVEGLGVAAALQRARDDLGVSVIVVEHDMRFIRAVADRVVVMHLGSVLAEGPPGEVLARSEVIEAYLGVPLEAAEGVAS